MGMLFADPARRLLGVVADLGAGANFVARRWRLALLFVMIPVLYGAMGGLGVLEVSGITLLQLTLPHGLRGKVIGLVLSLNGLSLGGGAWLAGRAERTGYYAVASGLILLLSLLWAGVNAKRPLERLGTVPDGPL
ncbi:hypothetical protein BH24DEI1_BH24DEI1_14840 [soil metagenome]